MTGFIRAYQNLPVAFWKILIAALGISLFFIFQEYTNHVIQAYPFAFSWFDISLKISAGFITWALLSPLIWWFCSLAGLRPLNKLLKTVLIALLLTGCHQTAVQLILSLGYYLKDGQWVDIFSGDNLSLVLVSSFSGLVQLLFFTAFFLFFDYYQRYVQKQKELNSAQLYALKMKLHPHFLFNTLHAVTSMIDYNKEGAQTMLTRLGSLFRNILENEDQHTVSLEQELEYIRNYLEIEKVRFEEQLEVRFEVSDETLDARVPSLIMQPLVENSIKHGISKMKSKGRIDIISRQLEDDSGNKRIALTVSDNGNGLGKPGTPSFGIGIKNVNDRLFRLYQNDFDFRIEDRKEQGTVAYIEIPYLQ